MKDLRIGYGYDIHRLAEGRPLILGGVHIDHSKGLVGHSDADVLLHAIIEALFGALALGDIGTHFPDDEAIYKNVDSRKLLRETYKNIQNKGYSISNIDSTIVAQQPKLAPYINTMRSNISSDIALELNRVSVKATTSEQLGFEGREQGICAYASVLIYK